MRLAQIFSRFDKPEYFFRPEAAVRRALRCKPPAQSQQVVHLNWGLDITVNAHESVGAEIWRSGLHDLVVSEAIWRLLEPSGFAIDAGAHVGYMSSIMLARAGSDGRVWAFEPHPDLFEFLKTNAERWRASGARFEIQCCALSDHSGPATLVSSSHFSANQGISFVAQTAESDATTHAITLKTLDELSQAQKISLLKVDVEGHESNVFKGAGALLSEGAIRDIVFEDWGSHPSAAMTFLAQNNYTLFGLGRSFWGPVLSAPDKQPGLRPYDSPAYLATKDPARALKLMRPAGWQILAIR